MHFKALKKKTSSKFRKLCMLHIYKIAYVIVHFVIISVSYLALIRPRFVELGLFQIQRKHLLYYYTYLQWVLHTNRLIL